MFVISVNIGVSTTIVWKGKEQKTGIFKKPAGEPIFLDADDVKNDQVIDRRYHGGIDKACYVFSELHYSYWKKIYPDLLWNWGMFGENLTVSGMDESMINIGDIYKIGQAIVQISQPRQPCYKLGIKFGTQNMVKQFVNYGYSGAYIRILEKGFVDTGDEFKLIEKQDNSLSVKEVFNLIYTSKQDDKLLITKALNIEALAQSCRNDLKKHWHL
jgi:MOSC domain-containing protein YiiM